MPRVPMLDVVPLDRLKIRELRLARGWSYAQAAERAGMAHRQQWQNIEAGRVVDPSFSTIERIARALAVSLDDLVADEHAGQ